MEEDRTLVDTVVAAPFAAVWRALREPHEIRRWHGWDYDGLDAEIDEIYVAGAEATREHVVVTFPGVRTRVEVTEHGERTGLCVRRGGGSAGDPIDEGWITFFHQLRFALERRPGEDRRTALLEPGEPPPGEPWFRTDHQVGVVVDGALVVATPERTIVSAYGRDDLDALRARIGRKDLSHDG